MMNSDLTRSLKLSEPALLEIYNYVPKSLSQIVMEVVVNQEKFGSYNSIFLEQEKPGNYWIIKSESSLDWLFPKGKWKFNAYDYSSLELLFECQGSPLKDTKSFIVKTPAKVSLSPDQKGWILQEKGSLEFRDFSLEAQIAQLQLILEQEQEEKGKLIFQIEQLKSQIQESEEASNQLQIRLEKSEKEREKLLLLSLQLQEEVSQKNNQLNEFIQQRKHNKTTVESQTTETKKSPEQDKNDINSFTTEINKLTEQVKNEITKAPKSLQKLINNSGFIDSIPNPWRTESSKQDSDGTFSPSSGSLKQETEEEKKIINNYNQQVDLSPSSTEVTVTEESQINSRIGKNSPIMLEKQSPGSYWIINGQQAMYLMPNQKRKFNTFQIASVHDLFECRNYGPGINPNNFKLVKPGKVSNAGDLWKLEEKGILDFNASG